MGQIVLDSKPLAVKMDNTVIRRPLAFSYLRGQHSHLVEDEEDVQVQVPVKVLEYLVLYHQRLLNLC